MPVKKIMQVVGARPQFIKSAPFELAIKDHSLFNLETIHTGQHYDDNMSAIFYEQLGLNTPLHMLNIGSYNHGKQTAMMMEQLEPIFTVSKPDLILVYGDTNSTLAAALVASKLHINVAHIEAGLRSFNKSMPEEINRIITDHISNILFVPSETATENLKAEGINNNVYNCGDIMLDMLKILEQKKLLSPMVDFPYYYATIHRPYNTDSVERLEKILHSFNCLDKKVIIALHPRTKNLLVQYNLDFSIFNNLQIIPPQGYIENISYMKFANRIITDSGGVQKEAYFLKVPCITIRPETEWIETLKNNWNQLVFNDLDELKSRVNITPGIYTENIYGKGNSADMMVEKITQFLN